MKEKAEISRTDLKQNIMRTIIFKIDYHGFMESEKIVDAFKIKFDSRFKSLKTTYLNKTDFDQNNLQHLSDNMSIPIRELQNEEIYRFEENTFGDDNLEFDISKHFSALKIECIDYKGIDEYLHFFSDYCDFLFDINEYLKVERIGLRKVGGKVYSKARDIFTDFEKKYFNFDFTDISYNSYRSSYSDVLVKDDTSGKINYSREFEVGTIYDRERDVDVNACQVTLDIDGYFGAELLKLNEFQKGKAFELLQNLNNEDLFSIFKMSVTKEFLNSNIHV